MRLLNVALIALFVLPVALMALAVSPWPAHRAAIAGAWRVLRAHIDLSAIVVP